MRLITRCTNVNDEVRLNQRIAALLSAKLEKDYPPGTLMRRDAHPKSHGLFTAEFIVEPNLPPELSVGLFAEPETYPCLIRSSNGNTKVQDDHEKDVRGVGIKVRRVRGRKILPKELDATTQDFLLCNHPTFFIRNVADYAEFMEHITKGTFIAFLSYFIGLNPLHWHLYEGKKLFQALMKKIDSPLRIQYWSQTPYRLGPAAVKYSIIPTHVPYIGKFPSTSKDYFRLTAAEELRCGDVYFDFMVQLQTDPIAMPIEDSTILWDERLSPFRKVATIRIPRQNFNTAARDAIAENLAFTPWHSLPEHEPLGNTNGTRKVVYDAISARRHLANGVLRVEPADSLIIE
jgi:hypothetical protein